MGQSCFRQTLDLLHRGPSQRGSRWLVTTPIGGATARQLGLLGCRNDPPGAGWLCALEKGARATQIATRGCGATVSACQRSRVRTFTHQAQREGATLAAPGLDQSPRAKDRPTGSTSSFDSSALGPSRPSGLQNYGGSTAASTSAVPP